MVDISVFFYSTKSFLMVALFSASNILTVILIFF